MLRAPSKAALAPSHERSTSFVGGAINGPRAPGRSEE
jgi:hypothetical protein